MKHISHYLVLQLVVLLVQVEGGRRKGRERKKEGNKERERGNEEREEGGGGEERMTEVGGQREEGAGGFHTS